MSSWLYQISAEVWPPERYRYEIWENEKWAWPVGTKTPKKEIPQPGDVIFFFYAKTGGKDPGIYGWAVVLEWYQNSSTPLYFRTVAPSDYLKMDPWWNEKAEELVNRIGGKFAQKTLWLVDDIIVKELRIGVADWLSRGNKK